MTHNFKKYPELTNPQLEMYYFESPHKQITEDFWAKVVKVHDGDTVRLRVSWRDFDFPLRMANIMAAEINEANGIAARDFLAKLILNQEVEILIDKKNRVEKWGRLLGRIQHRGFDIGEEMIQNNMAVGVWQDQMGIKELEILLDF